LFDRFNIQLTKSHSFPRQDKSISSEEKTMKKGKEHGDALVVAIGGTTNFHEARSSSQATIIGLGL
jgi:hypothetical protein